MKMRLEVYVLAVVAGIAGLAACNVNILKGGNQGQGQDSGSGPSDTPSPTAQCALVALDAGTAGDVTQIKQGATVGIGVSLIGTQGLELSDMCSSQFQPKWSGGAPCVLADTGFAGTLTAPLAAPIGATCNATVSIGTKTDSVHLEVVAP